MSNRRFSTTDWDNRHTQRVESYAKRIELIYLTAIREATRIGETVDPTSPEEPFSYEKYPQTRQRFEGVFQRMAVDMILAINVGSSEAWDLANDKNDALIRDVLPGLPEGTGTLAELLLENLGSPANPDKPKSVLPPRYFDRRDDARQAFQQRVIGNLNLSQRVFNYTGQFKQELELALDLGIAEGKSATQMSRDVRGYLQDPDKLFRRVRDKRGNLHLSKAAKSYHPGQGVYRSSYKNAMRLTRTEINAAYRESDNTRFQQLDFVVGFEVRRSNNLAGSCDVCGKLAGRYPKTFKFVGWHPQCRCHVVSILATRDELRQMNQQLLAGQDTAGFQSINQVTELPQGYTDWLRDNQERISRAKAVPAFMADNQQSLPRPAPAATTFVPAHLATYERELGVSVDRRIFSMLSKDTPFGSAGKGAYYSPSTNAVNIPLDERRRQSKWNAQSVVYHEFGHAIDWQQNLKERPEVAKLMNKYRKTYSAKKEAEYDRIDKLLWKKGEKTYNLALWDEMNQTSAAHDTLMSLNSVYGQGHSKKYFQIKGNSEAEFIAHAFENYFVGNPVFKSVMPELYADSIKLVEKWVKELSK